MTNEWRDCKEKMPKEDDILMVKLSTGEEKEALHYPDAVAWAIFYGHKTSQWYDRVTRQALSNVTHWKRISNGNEEM